MSFKYSNNAFGFSINFPEEPIETIEEIDIQNRLEGQVNRLSVKWSIKKNQKYDNVIKETDFKSLSVVVNIHQSKSTALYVFQERKLLLARGAKAFTELQVNGFDAFKSYPFSYDKSSESISLNFIKDNLNFTLYGSMPVKEDILREVESFIDSFKLS